MQRTLASRLSLAAAEWTVSLATTLLILGLHVVNWLQAGPLWRDEVNTLEMARQPTVAGHWAALYDSYPPLLPLLLRAWMDSGATSDLDIRLFGLLVGMAILGVLWLTVWRLGSSPPLVSLALFALSPLVIRSGDAIRPYGLAALFVLLTTGFIWRISTAPRASQIVLGTLSAIVTVQCLYTNAFLLLAVCVAGVTVALRQGHGRRALVILGIGLMAALSLVPYLPFLRQAQPWFLIMQDPLRRFPLGILQVWLSFLRALGLGDTDAPMAVAGLALLGWLELYAFAVPFARAGRGRAAPAGQENGADLACFAVTLLFAATLATWLGLDRAGLPARPWYFVPLMAVAGVALEVLFAQQARAVRAWRVGRLALVAGFVGILLIPAWQQVRQRQTNIDLAATVLSERAGAEDLVVVIPWENGVSFRRYYQGPAPWTTVPPIADHQIHRYDLIKQCMMEPDPLGPVRSRIAATLKAGHRVWWVGEPPSEEKNPPSPRLPPAPESPSGWFIGAYEESWEQELADYLRSHGVRWTRVPIPAGVSVNPYEKVPSVVAVQGWKTPDAGRSLR